MGAVSDPHCTNVLNKARQGVDLTQSADQKVLVEREDSVDGALDLAPQNHEWSAKLVRYCRLDRTFFGRQAFQSVRHPVEVRG